MLLKKWSICFYGNIVWLIKRKEDKQRRAKVAFSHFMQIAATFFSRDLKYTKFIRIVSLKTQFKKSIIYKSTRSHPYILCKRHMLLNIALELQTIMHIVIFSDQDSSTKKAIFTLKPQSPGCGLILLELLNLI